MLLGLSMMKFIEFNGSFVGSALSFNSSDTITLTFPLPPFFEPFEMSQKL